MENLRKVCEIGVTREMPKHDMVCLRNGYVRKYKVSSKEMRLLFVLYNSVRPMSVEDLLQIPFAMVRGQRGAVIRYRTYVRSQVSYNLMTCYDRGLVDRPSRGKYVLSRHGQFVCDEYIIFATNVVREESFRFDDAGMLVRSERSGAIDGLIVGSSEEDMVRLLDASFYPLARWPKINGPTEKG